ncbi:MAG TPA: flagellar basal body P-ring protein FlgI [Phycisphaerales bacterium]|jgi:flagellar P-ring protein precursor FlgI|nr:flagellar basal body P-ring protein FlgI [Phycisphaerales bacterium]
MARCHIALIAVCALTSASFAQPALPPLGANRPASLAANTPGAAPLVSGSLTRPRRENPVVSIQEFVRLEGQMTNTLRGVGIVTGLNKTGDSGKEMVLALPLARVYENNGIQIPDLKALTNAKSAAIVTLSVTLPEGGGREGDALDVFVQVSHSASSLKGGTLIISPLLGPRADDHTPYAMASGPIVLEDTDVPTTGRIRGGAVLMRDIRPQPVGSGFNLILRPYFRSYQVARTIASEINDLNANLDATDEPTEPIAYAVDETMVHVNIPKQERSNPTGFLANVMAKRFSPSLLDLPAMVVVNERTGSIIVTADVEISDVTVGNDKLVITTTTPAPTPTAQDPQVSRQNWTEFGTTGTGADRARVQDLLEAFKQLNVPAKEQIQILAQIYQAGRLHARFIRE